MVYFDHDGDADDVFNILTRTLLFSGYVQGMSDLLSPLLFVTQNEVESFWCLTGFMELVVSQVVG